LANKQVVVARPVVLACDTSSGCASIAILEGGLPTAEMTLLIGVGHSRDLLRDMRDLLTRRGLVLADVDLLVTSVGPGSFTGVRIAMASMKGLAMALDRRLVGVSVLDALAGPLLGRGAAVLTAMDARKSEVYAALYAPSGAILLNPRAQAPAALAEAVAQAWPKGSIIGVGEGVLAYLDAFVTAFGERLLVAQGEAHRVRAAVMARLGAAASEPGPTLADVEPLYLRLSEAEMKRS